jgi:hypothetical protein
MFSVRRWSSTVLVLVVSVGVIAGVVAARADRSSRSEFGAGLVPSEPGQGVERTPKSGPADAGGWAFLGAYTGPGPRGVDGLRDWEEWSGISTHLGLDFAPSDSWDSISGPDWQLAAWAGTGRRLIYSVPLFPHSGGSLADCAAGMYDGYWALLADHLVAHRLVDTIVRPGWEFNGDWYSWASAGRESDYAGCFRRLVDAMRAVPGQRFEFLWNPILGTKHSAGEPAYPGDAHVDYVGVDVYDTSWARDTYPFPVDASEERRAAARRAVWNTILAGEWGLRDWARFASVRGKSLVVPEWGLSARTDGHGGGDNAYFVERMLGYLADPATRPAFAMYFEADVSLDGGGFNAHRISAVHATFPIAGKRFRQIVGTLP